MPSATAQTEMPYVVDGESPVIVEPEVKLLMVLITVTPSPAKTNSWKLCAELCAENDATAVVVPVAEAIVSGTNSAGIAMVDVAVSWLVAESK